MGNTVFDIYSSYYDLLYKDKNYSEETDYIISLIKGFNHKANSILELGCGTGVHAKFFAENGFKIHGVDLSEKMLEMANQRKNSLTKDLSERISFSLSDLRHFKRSEKFDTAISLFHVISYMQSQEDLQQAFKTASDHLSREGLFIFDCWHGPGVLKDKPISRTKIFENELLHVKRISTPQHVEKENTVIVNFEVDILNKISGEKTLLNETHQMRYLFSDELISIATKENLQLIKSMAWLTTEEPTGTNWYACYVFKKQG